MEQELEILEAKFDSFLYQTIVGASMNYYNKQKKEKMRELQIIDNEDYEEYLKTYISKEDNSFLRVFGNFGNNHVLNCGVKSLSIDERTVIFCILKSIILHLK